MEDINKIDLIKQIGQEFISRISKKNNWTKDQIKIQYNESVIKIYANHIKSQKSTDNSIININNVQYRKIEGTLKHGDKYIIEDSYIRTFDCHDLECIEDSTRGAIKVEKI